MSARAVRWVIASIFSRQSAIWAISEPGS